MNSKKLCEKILSELLKDPDELSPEAKTHLEDCEECKAELEKIQKANALLKASAPAVPALKDCVLSRILDEKLVPTPLSSTPRKHIPIGTISAVAAVLAVGILVYKGDILNKIDTANSENEMIVYDEETALSPEALVEEWNNKTNGEKKSANYQIVADSANDSILYSDEEIIEECAEAEEEPAYDANPEKKLLKSEQESTETDDTAPTEAVKNGDIAERGHLLSLLPPTNDSVSGNSKPDGTQNAFIANDITSNSASAADGGTAGTTDSPAPAGVEDTEKAPEVMMLHPGSGMSGAAGGSSGTSCANERSEDATNDSIKVALGNISEKSDAAEVYKVLSQYYPDRISYEVFESADPSEYLAFVMSIDDFDSEYTESAFLGFCGKVFFESRNKTELL